MLRPVAPLPLCAVLKCSRGWTRSKLPAALVKALAAYADAAPAEFVKAAADDKANVQPIRDAIGQKYVQDVQAAMKTLELDKIDPDSAFRNDGFQLEVR